MNMVLNNDDRHLFDIEHLRTNARREIQVWVKKKRISFGAFQNAWYLIEEFSVRLLERDRPTVEETFPTKEFAWAVSKDKEKMEQATTSNKAGGSRRDFSYRRTDVFPLHETKAVDPDLRSSSPLTFTY